MAAISFSSFFYRRMPAEENPHFAFEFTDTIMYIYMCRYTLKNVRINFAQLKPKKIDFELGWNEL